MFYEEALTSLCRVLNERHEVNREKKYWRILIGPWLTLFTHVLFERWNLVRDYSGDHDLIENSELLSTYASDMREFSELILTPNWNRQIIWQLIAIKEASEAAVSVELSSAQAEHNNAITTKRFVKDTVFIFRSLWLRILHNFKGGFVSVDFAVTKDITKNVSRYNKFQMTNFKLPKIIFGKVTKKLSSGKIHFGNFDAILNLFIQLLSLAYAENYKNLQYASRILLPAKPKGDYFIQCSLRRRNF